MLESPIYYILASVLVSIIFSSCIALCLFSSMRRRYLTALEKVESSLHLLTSGSHGMGQKILVLENKLRALQCSQEEIKSSTLDFSYTTAEKLMHEGVDDRSIAANSGLSATEVSLMRLLHNRKQTAFTAHA